MKAEPFSAKDAGRLNRLAQKEFATRADAAHAEKMAAYMKTDQAFYGVPKDGQEEILKILKAYVPADSEAYGALVDALWNDPHRESQYLAHRVARRFHKFIELDQLERFERMVREGAWWDLIDPVATHMIGRIHQKHPAQMKPILLRYLEDDDLWIRRSAIIAQLSHKKDADLELLFECCQQCLHENEFFIQKAIGWALRQQARHHPKEVMGFVSSSWEALPALSYKETARELAKSFSDLPLTKKQLIAQGGL